MRILFDQGTPDPLRQSLTPHVVATVHELGWSTLQNGELLKAAEQDGYDVFVTTDTNIKYQQRLSGRQLSIVVLLSTSWPRIQHAIEAVSAAVGAATPGSYAEVNIPE